MNNLRKIQSFGQSIWLDFFNRQIMENGLLQRLIDEDHLSGITSNPSIFENAVLSSPDYDEDILKLANTQKSNEKIFFEFAIKDIKRAADILKPVYEESGRCDGFVSMEISPFLAYDTEGSIKQAIELWKDINRENVMIKIPGTKEGLPAIRKCTSEGLNINVTLLFGLERYREVAMSFIGGLEDRLNAHRSIAGITSVASFFLSRIDVLIDPILKKNGLDTLKGEVAIASAKAAYQIYKDVFLSDRFKKLEKKGATRQKVLWASTGTKDPSYSDVKYVETLIGHDTINTLTLNTMDAFRDHGIAIDSIENDLPHANQILKQLNDKAIDLNFVTQQLEKKGIEKFDNAFNKLLKAIDEKRKSVNVNKR